jgi:hypothetical protein
MPRRRSRDDKRRVVHGRKSVLASAIHSGTTVLTNGSVQPVPGDWVIVQNRLATGTRIQRLVRRFFCFKSRFVTAQECPGHGKFCGQDGQIFRCAAERRPFSGFPHQEWLPPSRTRSHPLSTRCRIRSRRFKAISRSLRRTHQLQTLRPRDLVQSLPTMPRADSLSAHHESLPGNLRQESPRSSQSTICHLVELRRYIQSLTIECSCSSLCSSSGPQRRPSLDS